MTFARMPGLLTALRNTFGEPAYWTPPGMPGPVAIQGRFRTDPLEVQLGEPAGLNVTQTWFFCDRADIPAEAVPQLKDSLLIRAQTYEIVHIDADDNGELGWRLLHADTPAALPEDVMLAASEAHQARGPGRPTRREEIVQAWAGLAPAIEPGTPMARVCPAVRRAITGSEIPAKGLHDKTIGKTLRELRGT